MRTLSPAALGWVMKRALVGWWNDNVPRLSASLAYYTLFALGAEVTRYFVERFGALPLRRRADRAGGRPTVYRFARPISGAPVGGA